MPRFGRSGIATFQSEPCSNPRLALPRCSRVVWDKSWMLQARAHRKPVPEQVLSQSPSQSATVADDLQSPSRRRPPQPAHLSLRGRCSGPFFFCVLSTHPTATPAVTRRPEHMAYAVLFGQISTGPTVFCCPHVWRPERFVAKPRIQILCAAVVPSSSAQGYEGPLSLLSGTLSACLLSTSLGARLVLSRECQASKIARLH